MGEFKVVYLLAKVRYDKKAEKFVQEGFEKKTFQVEATTSDEAKLLLHQSVKNVHKVIGVEEEQKNTLGSLFPDVLLNLKKELDQK